MAVEIVERTKSRVRVKCAFCWGTGRDPYNQLSRLSTCQVCGGRGAVVLKEPVIECAFCGGTGVHLDTRNTCIACHGRGAQTLAEPRTTCPACVGDGRCREGSMYCLTCNGTGMVVEGKALRGREAAKRSLTSSELDVLEVFRKAQETGTTQNLTHLTGFTPSYVQVLTDALADGGYLSRIGPKRLKLTQKGAELVNRERPKDRSPALKREKGPWDWRALGLQGPREGG